MSAAARAQTVPPVAAMALAIAVPGLGHVFLGKRQKALVFLLTIPAMFLMGLALSGRMFPFDFSQPLTGLAAVAARGVGVLAVAAGWLGYGQGVVTAAAYEYGNAFLIVAGLLNMLVVIDAYDIALGRK